MEGVSRIPPIDMASNSSPSRPPLSTTSLNPGICPGLSLYWIDAHRAPRRRTDPPLCRGRGWILPAPAWAVGCSRGSVDGGAPEWIDANVLDPQDREALGRLLAADDVDAGFFETPVEAHARLLTEAADTTNVDGLAGQRIGALRLVRLLGKGGIAVVFLAEREGNDFSEHVAVKLLRRGLYSEIEQRLFLRGRQVLAHLSHPHIARRFDGGVTEAGIP